MALICLETGWTPEQYWAITAEEQHAIIKAINRRRKSR